ncbi:MAG: histidine kinase [Desulfohalobiaceae bacterium]|nr:histidine kinase [Desulfohalobiaceae bacterium]
MMTKLEGSGPGTVVKIYLWTVLFNTGIALFLTWIGFGGGLGVNFALSQCIGLSICTSVLALFIWLRPQRIPARTMTVAAAILLGSLLGLAAGQVLVGDVLDPAEPGQVAQIIGLGIVFGSIISYFFYSRERIFAAESRLQEEQIKRLFQEKKALESNLKWLQAQVEPHFLFNTLSQVLSLLDQEPARARAMLEDFIDYLRSSLFLMRQEWITIEQEVELVRAYLNLFKVRMGPRLEYALDLDERLKEHKVPPLFVQPLVENAIKHGLEPKIEGGYVRVGLARRKDKLQIVVEDNGLGLQEDQGKGTGLSTIMERIGSIYGDQGRLLLEANQPCGLRALIELPAEE